MEQVLSAKAEGNYGIAAFLMMVLVCVCDVCAYVCV